MAKTKLEQENEKLKAQLAEAIEHGEECLKQIEHLNSRVENLREVNAELGKTLDENRRKMRDDENKLADTIGHNEYLKRDIVELSGQITGIHQVLETVGIASHGSNGRQYNALQRVSLLVRK